MKIKINKKSGFTLIELIMVIIVLGILAAVAIPQFADLSSDAESAAEAGVVGGVRAGIATYHAEQCTLTGCSYPASLDSASDGACTTSNACFDTVLAQGGITGDWTKAGTTYTGPDSGSYTYTAASGAFQ